MKTLRKFLLLPFLIMSLSTTTIIASDNIQIPDSLLTEDHIYDYTFSNFDKALRIIKIMRTKNKLSEYRLDIAEGDLYFNTGHYYQALKYYQRVMTSDSLKNSDMDYMEQVHRMISCYDCLHNDAKKTQYIELLLRRAKACNNIEMHSIALFNMGKTLYYQESKEKGYYYIDEAIKMMEKSDYKYKYDNLRYNYNTLFLMQKMDQKNEEALETLNRLEEIVTRETNGEPYIEGLNGKEKKTLYANRAVLLARLERPEEANHYYKLWAEIGKIYDKDNYLIMPYLFYVKRFDEIIRINSAREKFLREQKDTISYHMTTIKRSLARAYRAKGNLWKSADYFEQLSVLNDSIKKREQQSAALELAAVYETNEKETQLQEQANELRVRNLLLSFTTAIVILLLALLWRTIRHNRIIRQKNAAMATSLNGQISYRDKLVEANKVNRLLTEQLKQYRGEEVAIRITDYPDNDETATEEDKENKRIFNQLEGILIEQKLYLDRNFSRDDLIKITGVGKNRIGQIILKCTGMNATGYINGLRLEYAIGLIKKHELYTISSIAESCGIPSPSTFHRLFRERFGMTPTEYKETMQKMNLKNNPE